MIPLAVPRRGQRGFTLLELALTMLVAGILLTIAIPLLPRLGRTDLESSADRLASTMTYLADEASLRGRIYRLTLDLESDEWSVAAIAPYAAGASGSAEADGAAGAGGFTGDGSEAAAAARAEFREDPDDPMTRLTTLPSGVFLEAVIDRDGRTSSGKRLVYFLPEGLTESLEVRLGEKDGAHTSVLLDAARGAAHRGDTEEDSE